MNRYPATAAEWVLESFQETTATYDGVTKTVYRAGSGPPVIVIHEVPGITPRVAAFGRRLADSGFSVLMPSLFGTPGKDNSKAYTMTSIVRACISAEFHCLALDKPSPVTTWLRALAADTHRKLGGRGVGVVGMCLTGGFGLAMLLEPAVTASVLSQPALPLPFGAERRRSIGLGPTEWTEIERRTNTEECAVLGLRFTGDSAVPDERFTMLRDRLGVDFMSVEIDSSPSNPVGVPKSAHSVLTEDLVDRIGHPTSVAANQVTSFLKRRLFDQPPPEPQPVNQAVFNDAWRDVTAELEALGPPASGRHVFVSYAHEDVSYVTTLTKTLEAAGVRAWYDKDLATDKEWPTVLRDRLDTSAGLLLVMSPAAGSSQFVARELTWADRRDKPVLPLLLAGTPLIAVDHLQYIDVTGGQAPSAEFINEVRTLVAE